MKFPHFNFDRHFNTIRSHCSKEVSVVTVAIRSTKADERIERFTVIEFLAYCGGLLGVFMGISVLSLIELVYFPTLRLFWAIRQWKSENRVVPLKQESFEMITIEDHDE